MSSQLCIFTTGSNLTLLKESCNHYTINLQTYDPLWRGWVDGKLREGIKFLQTRTEPYAMWVDGNDSLVLKPEDEILARLHVLGEPVVIAAESTCWPDDRVAEYKKMQDWMVEPYPGRPAYLNAGGFIGPIGDVLTAMNMALSCAAGEDDQRAWSTAYLSGLLPGVQIDHARFIFSSIGDGDAALKADSCTKHFNGKINGREEYWRHHIGA